VVDRKDVASWLQGPVAQRPETDEDHPGRRLGMPRSGPGSIARFGRRLVAIFVDWTMCQVLAFGLFRVPFGEAGPGSWVPLGLFALENLLLVSTTGSTFGQRLLGIRLVSLNGGRTTVVQVLLRTFLLCLAVPALIWDRDGRGLHDKSAGTVLMRLS
jgi:uncharacterized RDD family membrane protein YckC